MNAEALLAVADAIEASEAFDLTTWVDNPDIRSYFFTGEDTYAPGECGTTCCIAGWANWLNRAPGVKGLTAEEFSNIPAATRFLGLDRSTAMEGLFMAGATSVWARLAPVFGWEHSDSGLERWDEITPAQAAIVLRLIAHGEVDL